MGAPGRYPPKLWDFYLLFPKSGLNLQSSAVAFLKLNDGLETRLGQTFIIPELLLVGVNEREEEYKS